MISSDRPSKDFGDFAEGGRWNPFADKKSRGSLYHFIADLVNVRRLGKASPAQIADHIAKSKFAWAFSELNAWAKESKWSDWAFMPCRTAADACVKYCGTGSGEDAHWEGGLRVLGPDHRKLSGPDPEHVKQFVASLAAAMPGKAGPSDQMLFDGCET